MGEILDIGVTRGVIKKSGAFYSYEDTRLGQGRENARNFLKENTELAKEIEEKVRANNKPTYNQTEETSDDEE